MYAQAQTLAADSTRHGEVENLLYTIGSNNGRLEDVRDGYALLRGLFQQAWMRDNRPYWLQIDLSRYDRATELWIDRSLRWDQLIHNWYDTHTLPSAVDAGLPPAPAK